MITHDYAITCAHHYDCAAAQRQDVDFWVDIAKLCGGPVLELACGTGRVALPIARCGLDVCGVDQANAILEVFGRKLLVEPESVRGRARLFQGDLRTLRLEQEFALVLAPFRPVQHMLTIEDQLAAFSTAPRASGARGNVRI